MQALGGVRNAGKDTPSSPTCSLCTNIQGTSTRVARWAACRRFRSAPSLCLTYLISSTRGRGRRSGTTPPYSPVYHPHSAELGKKTWDRRGTLTSTPLAGFSCIPELGIGTGKTRGQMYHFSPAPRAPSAPPSQIQAGRGARGPPCYPCPLRRIVSALHSAMSSQRVGRGGKLDITPSLLCSINTFEQGTSPGGGIGAGLTSLPTSKCPFLPPAGYENGGVPEKAGSMTPPPLLRTSVAPPYGIQARDRSCCMVSPPHPACCGCSIRGSTTTEESRDSSMPPQPPPACSSCSTKRDTCTKVG